ncbi:phage tail tube protein [Muricomes intestini]|uniref:phage tail tube protein n=1 Tax=Muricomes intestini TaxID=1796634 RepID=UPI002FDD4F29
MARLKNALRGHFIGVFTAATPTVPPTEWLELAKWISTVGDETEEQTDDTGFYDGDGTPETSVTGVAGAYSFEGFYDAEDPAQAMIAGMKYKIGDDRKVWHKIVSADGEKQWVGPATVSNIIAGAGDATEFEDFSCTITYNQLPTESPVSGV